MPLDQQTSKPLSSKASTDSPSVFIFKLGQTFTDTESLYHDFDHWVMNSLSSKEPQKSEKRVKIVNVMEGETLPDYDECCGVILTGSHAMVTDRLPWSEQLKHWLVGSRPYQIPLFGICYGHQLLADAFGGLVSHHPKGIEIGTVEIDTLPDAQQDPLFGDLFGDFPASFLGHCTHSQTIIRLPAEAVILAKNKHEPHHAFRLENHIWGVQFHPEFTPTIMHEYIAHQPEAIQHAQLDQNLLAAQVQNTPWASQLLSRFVQFCNTNREDKQ